MTADLAVKWGSVTFHSFSLSAPKTPLSVTVTSEGKPMGAKIETVDGKSTVTLQDKARIKTGETVRIVLSFAK
jgi:hypothetical protein